MTENAIFGKQKKARSRRAGRLCPLGQFAFVCQVETFSRGWREAHKAALVSHEVV